MQNANSSSTAQRQEPVGLDSSSAAPEARAQPQADKPAPGTLRHPLLWVPTLYAAESLPFNAAILVSVMMYKSFGLSDSTIAFWTAWLLLPWTLKPFFSPFLEVQRSKKAIVVATQLIAGVGFGVVAFAIPLPFWFQATLSLFFILAFNSATHDTAADGLYIDALNTEAQAKYIGFQSAFWNIGQVVAQGGLTILAGWLERTYDVIPAWMAVWGAFGVAMLLFALYHATMAPKGNAPAITEGALDLVHTFKEVSIDFFLKKNIGWLITFAVLYRSAEGQMERMAQLFLRAKISEGGLGLSTADVGFAYGTAGTVGMVAGSLAGGWFASKVGLRKALLPLALILNIPNALFTYLAFSQNSQMWVVTLCASIEKFSLGMGFVAMTLVCMQQMAPGKYSTAHYGFATAIWGIGMMVPSMTSGFVADAIGYRNFYVYILAMGLPSIAVAALLPLRDNPGSTVVPDDAEGRVIKQGAWATAVASGNAFLFTAFSGIVTGPVLFGEAFHFAYLVVYAVLLALGLALIVYAARLAQSVKAMARALPSPVRHQGNVALTVAVVALLLWSVSAYGLVKKNGALEATRALCQTSSEAAACETVCKNDGTYAVCRKVMAEKVAGFDAAPNDSAAAAAALEFTNLALSAGCFTESHPEDCMALGKMAEDPGRWIKANPELSRDLSEAKRYYKKGCLLGDSAACQALERTKKAMVDEERAGK